MKTPTRHDHRAGPALPDVPDHVCRPSQYRDCGCGHPEASCISRTRNSGSSCLRVRISRTRLPGLRRLGRRSLRSAAGRSSPAAWSGPRRPSSPGSPASSDRALSRPRAAVASVKARRSRSRRARCRAGRRPDDAGSRRGSPTRSPRFGNAVTPPLVACADRRASTWRGCFRGPRLLQPDLGRRRGPGISATARPSIRASRPAELDAAAEPRRPADGRATGRFRGATDSRACCR